MKCFKILIALVVLACVGYSADETVSFGRGYYNENALDTAKIGKKPNNLTVLQLYDADVAASRDTIATTKHNVHGPFPLTTSDGDPLYEGFGYISEQITGTSPTMAVAYLLSPTAVRTDTANANWVYFDTIAEYGGDDYVSFSYSTNGGVCPAGYLYFKVDNYDGSETQIPNDLWLIFKHAYTYNKK